MAERFDIIIREDGSRTVKKAIADIGDEAGKTGKAVELLKTALEFAGITVSIAAFVNFAQQGIEVSNVLKNATSSAEEFNAALKATQATAIETGTSTQTLAELYDTLATAGKTFHATQTQTSSIVDTIAKAFAAEGKSASEAGGAINGLARALLTGTADMRGFLTVLNSSNLLAETMAHQFGLTAGAFVEAVKAGKISSEDFFKALLQSKSEIENAYQGTSRTLSQAFGSLLNSLIALVTNFENATHILAGVAQVIKFLADNIKIVATIMGTLAGAWILDTVRMSLATGLLGDAVKALRVGVVLLNLAWYSNPIGLVIAAVAALAAGVYFLYTQWDLFRKAVDTVLVSLGLMSLETARAHEAAARLAQEANKAAEANNLLAETGHAAATSLNLLAREADGSAKAVDSYGNAITVVVQKHMTFAESVKAAVENLGGSYADLTGGVKTADSTTVHFGNSISNVTAQMGQGQAAAAAYTGQLRNLYDIMKNISDVTFDSNGIGGGNFKGKSTINVGSPQDIVQQLKDGQLTGNYLVDTSNANLYGFVGNIWLENYKKGVALYWEEMRQQQANAATSSASQNIQNTPLSSSSPLTSQQSLDNNRPINVPVTIITPNPSAFGASQAQIQRMIASSINHALDQT